MTARATGRQRAPGHRHGIRSGADEGGRRLAIKILNVEICVDEQCAGHADGASRTAGAIVAPVDRAMLRLAALVTDVTTAEGYDYVPQYRDLLLGLCDDYLSW